MNRTVKILLIAVAAFIIGGVGTYFYLVRPTKPPSGMVRRGDDDFRNPPPDTSPVTPPLEHLTASSTERIYSIDPSASHVQFSINEVLRGEPTTPVGTTNQIEGEMAIDRANVSAARVGTIRIDARGLATDKPQRDNAIKRFILKSELNANEYIDFAPTALSGVPKNPKNGEPFNFTVTGNLTISGTTKEATFSGAAKFISDDEISGSATTTVHRADYGLNIPNIPFVANVDDNVPLQIDFDAKAAATSAR